MALIDVKKYYIDLLDQYIEMKNDLDDFQAGIAEGYVTEDDLQAARDDVAAVKNNLDRLSYVLYLFELPQRPHKKVKYRRSAANESLEKYFKDNNADEECVLSENTSVITHLRDELKKLTK